MRHLVFSLDLMELINVFLKSYHNTTCHSTCDFYMCDFIVLGVAVTPGETGWHVGRKSEWDPKKFAKHCKHILIRSCCL